MSERIDHVTEANDALAVLSNNAPSAPQNANIIAEAQVHATLALVEQQRIANRLNLAVIDLTEEIGSSAVGHDLTFRIRPYLTLEDWRAIEVPEDDEVNSWNLPEVPGRTLADTKLTEGHES